MKAKHCLTFAIVILLLFCSCTKKKALSPPGENAELLTYLVAPPDVPNADKALKRFIAISHRIVVETPESDLVNVFESALKFSKSIRCEVLKSSIVNQTLTSPPRGELYLRIDPGDLEKFFGL